MPQKTMTISKENHLEFARSVSTYSDYLARNGSTTEERYILMALRDPGVVQHMIHHALEGQMFAGGRLLGGIGIPEEVRLLFSFVYLPPKISFAPSYFLVRLNVITGAVDGIVDPYFGPVIPIGTTNWPSSAVSMPVVHTRLDVDSDFRIHDVALQGTSLVGKIRAYLHLKQNGPFGSTIFDITVVDIDQPFSIDLIFDRPITLYSIGPVSIQVTLHNHPRRICGEVQVGVDLPVVGHWGQKFSLVCVNF